MSKTSRTPYKKPTLWVIFGVSQNYSVGDRSDASARFQYCRNLLLFFKYFFLIPQVVYIPGVKN